MEARIDSLAAHRRRRHLAALGERRPTISVALLVRAEGVARGRSAIWHIGRRPGLMRVVVVREDGTRTVHDFPCTGGGDFPLLTLLHETLGEEASA